ncbi:MAG: prolyl oligopeptidase family serine peptidase [Pseudomonadota bacterium]|nr:prolyl oligopeptidase family serine peptidase [Pseudomonadota bacterium]
MASTVDLPSMGAREVPLTSFSANANSVEFQLDGPPGRFLFSGQRNKGKLVGEVVHGEAKGNFTLVEVLPPDPALARDYTGSYQVAPGHVIDIGSMDEAGGLLVFLDHKTLREGPLFGLSATKFVSGPTIAIAYPFVIHVEFQRNAKGVATGLRWQEAGKQMSARKIAPHRVEDVTVRNGDVVLQGTLMLPDTPGPHPAVVFAHGSGDATRNVAIWNPYFVRLGMAVLSLDKRGAGKSTGDWHTASMDDIAGDWLAGVEMLKQRTDIDPARIGVHGSSQGGWTAPLMAARSKDIAFVIVRAGSGVSVSDTMVHEIGWSAREAGLPEPDALAAEAAARTMFDFAGRNAAWTDMAAFVAQQEGKPWSSHVWPFKWSRDGWGKPWTARNLAYDATESLRKIQVPVLWFLGDMDHNVPTEASERALYAALHESGHPDYRVVRLPKTGHSFLASDTGNNADIAKQSHMVDGYWNVMEEWLRARRLVR